MGKAINTALDPDLFWHLRVAEQLGMDGIGPLVDRISFASMKQPWTPYSWLAELGMKGIWDGLGFRGTILVQALAIVGTLMFITLACVELAGPERRLNCIVATAIAAYLSLAYLSFRPATFAIFLLSAVTYLLVRDRRMQERSRALWLIVPVTVLLTNIHLSAVMVPAWVACVFAGSIWEGNWRSVRRYLALLLATLLACLCTPMLGGAIRSAWHYQFNDPMVAGGHITEMSPIYQGASGIATTIGILALVALALRNRESVRTAEWIWLALAGVLMLRLGRFAPMFAMIAAPVLAGTLPKLSDVVLTKRPVLAAMAVVLALGLFRSVVQFPRNQTLDSFLDRDEVFRYPTAAARYVDQHVASRSLRLINEFSWGGYLAWRLGEKYQVLMDGRTQLYSRQFWAKTYFGDEASRVALLKEADGDVAIVPVQRSIFRKPLEQMGWRNVYQDQQAVVLVPPAKGFPSTAPDSRAPGSASSKTREAAAARQSGSTPARPAYARKN